MMPRRQRGRLRDVIATVAVATVVVSGAALIPGVVSPTTGGGGGDITCNLSSTSASDFTADLTAAANGDTICLTNAVDYGTFSGTTKNLTIVAQSGGSGPEQGVDATLRVDVGAGDTGIVTIDGGMDAWSAIGSLNIPEAAILDGAANLTLTDFEINGAIGSGRRWDMGATTYPPQDGNILIDHFYAHDVLGGEALFYIDDVQASGAHDTGITIQNGWFNRMSNDGVKLTGDDTVRVLNNKFTNFHESLSGDGNHTDEIQMLEGNHIITGNWLADGDQCLFSDDGTTNNTITHNVIDDCGQHFMTVSSDNAPSSTIAYNTITDRTQDLDPYFECGTNYSGGFTSEPDLQNNIFQRMNLGGTNGGPDCAPTANHHNMLATGESTTGTGGSNFTGTQTYVGGSDLSAFDSFSDFCLDSSSAGYTSASDGGQVGVCGGDYNGSNYGPPAS